MPADPLVLPYMVDAFRGGRWALAVSLAIALLVWFGRALLPSIVSPKRARWLAAILGTLSGVLGQLAADQPATLAAWLASVEQGLRTAGGAMLLWTLLLKRLSRRNANDLIKSAEDAARKTPKP